MSITLGGISLHNDLRFEPELESIPTRVQESMKTRGGNDLRWEKTLKDRPFDLIGGEDYGWCTLANMQALKALADTDKWEGTLSMNGTTMTVYFRHSDSPAISFSPVPEYNYADRSTADKVCNVRIKLVWKVA